MQTRHIQYYTESNPFRIDFTSVVHIEWRLSVPIVSIIIFAEFITELKIHVALSKNTSRFVAFNFTRISYISLYTKKKR